MLTKAIRGSVVGRRVVGRDRLGGIGEYRNVSREMRQKKL
jgi:hypothetical protein